MHGLREKDINHKDKQNYEAVLRMTSESVFRLLNQIPDAKGTVAYLQVLRCVIDSYLDKSLLPLARIKKNGLPCSFYVTGVIGLFYIHSIH